MISFCIITKGDRPEKLAAEINSIKVMNISDCEIYIAVDVDDSGRLGMLRNQACRAARGEILIVCDDDLLFGALFYDSIVSFTRLWEWDILCPCLLNPDGSRYWDWREVQEDGSQMMVDYSQPDNGLICPPGAVVVLKREVFKKVQWNESLKYYQPPYEDIDFARRLHSAGYKCMMSKRSTVYHYDPRYHQKGQIVVKE
jgi:Glycosyltransferase like family 2